MEDNVKYENPYKERFFRAIHYDHPDHTPFTGHDMVIGKIADPSYCPGDNYTRPEWAMDVLIKAAKILDGDVLVGFDYTPGMNAMMPEGTRYLTPGKDCDKELGPQAMEHNLMEDPDGYDYVIEHGWNAYKEKYIDIYKTPEDFEEMEKYFGYLEQFAGKCAEAGLMQYDFNGSMYMASGGNYIFSMLRGFSTFLKDCRRMPEKVKEAIAVYNNEEAEGFKMFLQEMPYDFIMTNMSRTDNNTMSRKMFEEIVWPEVEFFDKLAREQDVYMVMHIDGDYTADADLLSTLHAKRTLLQFDGFADVVKMAPFLTEGKISVWGDIPPQMMSMGSSEAVYERCMRLKDAMGDGLILSAGCYFPLNSRIENIWAMKKAALGEPLK